MKNNRKNLIYRISSYITIFSPIIGSGFPSNFHFCTLLDTIFTCHVTCAVIVCLNIEINTFFYINFPCIALSVSSHHRIENAQNCIRWKKKWRLWPAMYSRWNFSKHFSLHTHGFPIVFRLFNAINTLRWSRFA